MQPTSNSQHYVYPKMAQIDKDSPLTNPNISQVSLGFPFSFITELSLLQTLTA
jgi:hypothetical protein